MRMAIRWTTIIIAVVAGQAAFSASISLSLPELTWALEIAAPGFVIENKEIAPNGDGARLQAKNKETGLILSAFLERAPQTGNSIQCRDYYWGKAEQSPLKKEQITLYETGGMAVVEYIIPEYQGIPVKQINLNAYLAKDEYWIDVHVSKVGHETGDIDPLKPILKSIQINKSYAPTSADRFDFGNLYYRRRDFAKAIPQYEKALDIEKQQPSLDRTIRIVLIDQLGMSYGISGNLAKSRQLYEWAVTTEPKYPMFYYNLACTFAEMNNLDKAIENLRSAFKYKDNSLPGESVPDPSTDSSFAKYRDDPTFKAELGKIRNRSPNQSVQPTRLPVRRPRD